MSSRGAPIIVRAPRAPKERGLAEAILPPPSPARRAPRLRLTLLAGAAYDGAVGLLAAVRLETLAALLRVPVPAEPFYARAAGILLVGLGLFYLAAALDLARSLRGAAAAVAVRTVGGGFVLGCVLAGEGTPAVLSTLGFLDLAFGAMHYACLRRETGKGFLVALLRG